MSRPQAFKRLVTLAVLLSLCSALLISGPGVQAAGHAAQSTSIVNKISPDLRQLILSGQGDKRVKVIVQQAQETSSTGLLGLLNTVGGLLEGVLALLNIRIVEVRVNDVELLATVAAEAVAGANRDG